MTALTLRPELDQLRCAEPGCDCTDELVLGSVCHPEAPVWAVFVEVGELRLECAECEQLVITVAVAG